MTKTPSDKTKSSRETRLQQALRANLARRKVQARARREVDAPPASKEKGFEDSRLGVCCCGHVFRRERPALLIVREDGDWQFLCGGSDHNDPQEPYHVSVGVLIEVDPTLHQIADLPPEWEAERTETGGDWLRTAGTQ